MEYFRSNKNRHGRYGKYLVISGRDICFSSSFQLLSSLGVTAWLNRSLQWYWSSHLILSRKANKQISENVKRFILKRYTGFNHILEHGIFVEIRQTWLRRFVIAGASSVINSLRHLALRTMQLLASAVSDECDNRRIILPLHHMTPSSMVLISKVEFIIPLSRVELRWRYALSLCLSVNKIMQIKTG